MLNRQYGVAASSSIVKVAHPEDSQPNERIQGRNRNGPPKLNTVRPPRFNRIVSNSLGSQMARRGTWNTRLPTRSRQETSSWPKTGPSGPRHHPPIHVLAATSSHSATHPVQQTSSSTWVAPYKSMSPKLPAEPIRRRTPTQPGDRVRLRPSSPIPLPGRKRKPKEPPPPELPPPQKLKIEPPSVQPGIKQEPSSPESVATSRRLVDEACSFWPTPENCRKSVSNYSENRREFARAKNRELVRFGLQRTRAFFREDGLVIEWRSKVPVWNDTLLPEKPLPQFTSSKTPPSGVSEILKRKRDVIEIIDVDVLPTEPLPSKNSRPSEPELTILSAQKRSGLEPRTPSPKKVKVAGKHWSAGLSKEGIRKLGRGVEAASVKPPPPPPSLAPPNSWPPALMTASVTPVSSPTKRLALPTRLTPSERKIVSAAYSATVSSSPDRDREARSTLDTVSSGIPSCSGLPSTVCSKQETISKLPFNNDVDVFLSPQPTAESTNEVNAPAGVGKSTNSQADPSASNFGAALLEGGEVLDSIFGSDNDAPAAQTSQAMDPQVKRKPENMKNEAAAQSEVESQEIERLCTDDSLVDLPEYEMAEDFLRRFISLFDADRNELGMAYSNDALLSCRVPLTTELESSASNPAPPTLHVGRTEIMDKLNGLIGYHFSPVEVPSNTIDYDIAVLSQEVVNSGLGDGTRIDKDAAVGGVLATLHSRIIHSSSDLDHTLRLHQSFLLRRRTELDDSGSDESTSKLLWPLSIISHQMIFRDKLLVPPAQDSSSQHGSAST